MNPAEVSRSQAGSGTITAVRVVCADGTPRIVNARIPAGIKDKQSIRLSQAKWPAGINWPAEGITIPVRVRDRRLAHSLVAVTVLAGAIAQAWVYAAAVAAAWALILFCLQYARTHAPEGRAPAAPGRLWSLWMKLDEGPVFFLLIGAYLFTCLLLSWRSTGTPAGTPGPGSCANIPATCWTAGRCRPI
jgi:hypothetical protein